MTLRLPWNRRRDDRDRDDAVWLVRTAHAMDHVGGDQEAVRTYLRGRWGRKAPDDVARFIRAIKRLAAAKGIEL